MVKTDQLVVVIDMFLLFIYSTVWTIGRFTHRLSWVLAFLNAVSALMLIVYWAINELSIEQHFVETKEVAVLVLELLVLVLGLYTFFFRPVAQGFKTAQYIIFGIHFTLLVAVLIFMATFSMKKLW